MDWIAVDDALMLRRMTAGDYRRWHRLVEQEPEASPDEEGFFDPLGDGMSLTRLMARADELHRSGQGSHWVVVENGALVGMIGTTKHPATGGLEVGVGLLRQARGRGVMTRALAAFSYATLETTPALSALHCRIRIGTVASLALFQRVGFVQTGRKPAGVDTGIPTERDDEFLMLRLTRRDLVIDTPPVVGR